MNIYDFAGITWGILGIVSIFIFPEPTNALVCFCIAGINKVLAVLEANK